MNQTLNLYFAKYDEPFDDGGGGAVVAAASYVEANELAKNEDEYWDVDPEVIGIASPHITKGIINEDYYVK